MKFLVGSFAVVLIAVSIVPRIGDAQNMTIRADLTDAPRGLIRGTLSMPVKPGPLTLIYPQWIPGDHSPTRPISDLSALKFSAGGKAIPFFGLELPALIGESKSLAKQIKEVHEAVATLGYVLVGLHAAAALAHHYVIKDNTLRRMLPLRGQ